MAILNDDQKALAAHLAAFRPALIPGTCIIADPVERKKYYDAVTALMKLCDAKGRGIQDFCDLAGVPD